jgi:hypothetical protein
MREGMLVNQRQDLVEALRTAWEEAGEHLLEDRDDSMWCVQCNETYELSDCEVADGFACPSADIVNKDGYCYQIAGSTLIRSGVTDAMLVHATVKGNIDHAWLEYDGHAFDFSKREIVRPAESYRSIMAARGLRVFSLQEAAHFISTESHWGPWDVETD